MHNWRTTHSPIALSISPMTCVVFSDSAFHKVLYSCLGKFPYLSYTHTNSTSQPFVGFNTEMSHIHKVIVSNPPLWVLFQLLLPLFVSLAVASTCHLF